MRGFRTKVVLVKEGGIYFCGSRVILLFWNSGHCPSLWETCPGSGVECVYSGQEEEEEEENRVILFTC